jgi:phosphogluconate dehydratase
LSGASGKVPFAIHCTPEAADGGLLARVEDGDLIRMDARNGALELLVDEEELAARIPARPPAMPEDEFDLGRHIFAPLRRHLAGAEQGGSSIFAVEDDR